MEEFSCLPGIPNINNLFDFSIAPPLLFYSYVPMAIISIILGLFVVSRDRKSLKSVLFLLFTLTFSLKLISEIILWVSNYNSLIHFFWEISSAIPSIMFMLFLLFIREIFNQKTSFTYLLLLFVTTLPIILMLGTPYHLLGFEPYNCESLNGPFVGYVYIYELFLIVLTVFSFYSALKYPKENLSKKMTFVMGSGALLFLSIFYLSYFLAEIYDFYTINIVGSIGMLIFIISFTFSIVRFHLFNIKLLAPQALVFAVIFLNFAVLFIRRIENVRIVIVFTLIISSILGFIMVRAVKKVDEQREALDLANRQQTNLLHFISHQVKGFFTKSRNAFSGLLEGDYGPLPETALHVIQEGFDSDNRGVQTVQEILNAANIKTGNVTYLMVETNLVNLIKDVILLLKPAADKKQVAINFNPAVQSLIIKADTVQLQQAVKNLIDNSIKYTPSGKIDISLEVSSDKKQVVIKVADTGVGIHDEDMPKLFSEGGRGKDSLKVNVDSTGYGLYIVKNIIKIHGGTVTAYSGGEGHGSVFTVVLPVK